MNKQIRTRVVGIYVDTWQLNRHANSFYGKWINFVRLRANPRGRDYMQALFKRRFPDQDFVPFSGDLAVLKDTIRERSTIVIVFPDAIGHGLAKVEKYLLRNTGKQQQLLALSGRGREFPINASVLRQLRLRRLLEKLPIADCLLLTGMLLISPFCLLFDSLRGNQDV